MPTPTVSLQLLAARAAARALMIELNAYSFSKSQLLRARVDDVAETLHVLMFDVPAAWSELPADTRAVVEVARAEMIRARLRTEAQAAHYVPTAPHLRRPRTRSITRSAEDEQ